MPEMPCKGIHFAGCVGRRITDLGVMRKLMTQNMENTYKRTGLTGVHVSTAERL
jgi:hypothetical protein